MGYFSANSFFSGKNIGTVLNMDTSDKGGSHWVSIFFKASKGYQFDYFDSVGNEPPPEVQKLINDIKKRYSSMKVNINRIDHQLGSTECGVYSINFIINRLNGKSFESVSKNIIRDSEMNKKRKVFFLK